VHIMLDFEREKIEDYKRKKLEELEAITVLDELFKLTLQFKKSQKYLELLKFIAKFRHYSPFNAMLVYIQMPGACFFNSAKRWYENFNRLIKPAAKPLIILRPGGPIMLVYDVSDTEPDKKLPIKDLPEDLVFPFEATSGSIGMELNRVLENCKRDLIQVRFEHFGSLHAGSIQQLSGINSEVKANWNKSVEPIYLLRLSNNASQESQFVSLLHELAHLYCGHIGTPDEKWWPDRTNVGLATKEFEAESVAFIVCSRVGIKSKSELYLANYMLKNEEIPEISFDTVLKAAFLIESMTQKKLPQRAIKESPKPEKRLF